MKNIILKLIVFVTLLVGAIFLFFGEKFKIDLEGKSESQTQANDSLSGSGDTGKEEVVDAATIDSEVVSVTVVPGLEVLSATLSDESYDIENDLSILVEILERYRHVFGEIPNGGWNQTIVSELTGENDKRLAVIPANHSRISEEGELLDRFGTPYHFHPVSASTVEVRSAGPDKVLYTEDDAFSH